MIRRTPALRVAAMRCFSDGPAAASPFSWPRPGRLGLIRGHGTTDPESVARRRGRFMRGRSCSYCGGGRCRRSWSGRSEKRGRNDGKQSLTGVQGSPLVGSAGRSPRARRSLAVERSLKEIVSKRGQCAGMPPQPNPREIASQRCGFRESSTPVPQSGRPSCPTIPHGSASGGKGVPPDPAAVARWV